jgi:hypothetical protein
MALRGSICTEFDDVFMQRGLPQLVKPDFMTPPGCGQFIYDLIKHRRFHVGELPPVHKFFGV